MRAWIVGINAGLREGCCAYARVGVLPIAALSRQAGKDKEPHILDLKTVDTRRMRRRSGRCWRMRMSAPRQKRRWSCSKPELRETCQVSHALRRDLAGLHGIERVGDTAPSSRELVPISAKLAEISRSPIERKGTGDCEADQDGERNRSRES